MSEPRQLLARLRYLRGGTPPAGPLPPRRRRSTRADLVAGASLLVLIFCLFQSWFTIAHRLPGTRLTLVFQDRFDALQVHSYLWVVLGLAVIGLTVLVCRAAGLLPGSPQRPGQMLVAVSCLALAITVLAVVSKPPAEPGAIALPLIDVGRLSTSWSYGGFVAIAAALVALIATITTSGLLQGASRAQHAVEPATR